MCQTNPAEQVGGASFEALEFGPLELTRVSKFGFRISCFLVASVSVLTLPGCLGYQIGPGTLYRPDIASIRIPIFESDSYRRFLGERLTEAVIKEIQLKTGYRVIQSADADSVLQGRLVSHRKTVGAENLFDEPRVLEVDLLVEIRWIDRQGGVILQNEMAIPQILLAAQQQATFVPESGQSVAVAQQQAINELAAQIVAKLERAW